ncbi:MAG: hypothetical protein IJT58_06885 [Synergistaceae bacterium]|nr:hypothetical protein [Synergistaceae bacterium]
MLIVFIAGCVYRIAEYKSWFALRYYRIEAQSQALEQRLWDIFPQRCLAFWPYLLKDSRGMGEFLERDMPVTVETHMEGFGRFKTVINWLKAWVKVQWRGKIWCISRDGKMWLSEKGRPNESEAGSVIWKIPEQGDLQDGVTISTPEFGVFDSPISTEIISSFVEEFSGYRWFDAATEITWERRAGMDLFVLKLSHGRQNFELFLQRDKYPGQDVGAILDELFSRLLNEGGSHIIDATYEGKILLRNL